MLDKNDGADSADTPDRGRIATGVETGTAPGDRTPEPADDRGPAPGGQGESNGPAAPGGEGGSGGPGPVPGGQDRPGESESGEGRPSRQPGFRDYGIAGLRERLAGLRQGSKQGSKSEGDGGKPDGPGDGARGSGKRRPMRTFTVVVFVVAVALSALWMFFGGEQFRSVKTSEGIQLLKGKTVERVQVTEGTQQVRLWLSESAKAMDSEGKRHEVGKRVEFEYVQAQGEQVAKLVEQAKPRLGYDSRVPQTSIWSSILTMVVPIVIIIGAFMFLLPRMQSGIGAFGRVRDKKQLDADRPDVTFDDVAGEDEAVAELREITDFLTAPDRYHALGAKIPRGVLLYGPPGTGKTLLARAVAGEAGVPFYSISASEFVEMFVGVGASRVRDLFAKAKENAPAIVFVDEIDAVGRGRGVGIGGGNDEREQTLNQLLVELDGFDLRTNVILIAATNRPDVLDPALLRPGRFDRQISVDAPDLQGRAAILGVHAKGKPIAEGIDLEMIARRTPGYTGADLENILNEAALLAARFGRREIVESDVDEAIDRVMAGPQRRSRVMNDADKLLTAYHEAGHALAAAALHNADPVTKVTILPRGRALGYTMVLPTEDRYSVYRNDLLDQLTYAMGGRVAEEIVFHDPTTGASNDIQKATGIAWKMVTEYGMSAEIGMIRLASEDADPMTRALGGGEAQHSDALVSAVDREVRRFVDAAHREAWRILTDNRAVLDTLAGRLIEKETVLEAELSEIFAGVVEAPVRGRWHAFDVPEDLLAVTEIPPIEVISRTPDGDGADAPDEVGAADGSDLAAPPEGAPAEEADAAPEDESAGADGPAGADVPDGPDAADGAPGASGRPREGEGGADRG